MNWEGKMPLIIGVMLGLVLGVVIGVLVKTLEARAQSQRDMAASYEKTGVLEKELTRLKAETGLRIAMLTERFSEKQSECDKLGEQLENARQENLGLQRSCLSLSEKNLSLSEKLETQKQEIEDLGKKFNLEFENIAAKIIETKSEKFTELNKANMLSILEPLEKNLGEFKKTINETYDKESKERFSLGERVKELAQLNQTIGEEARNLTKALKGESKTQGCWGEMILETILEKSGLRKDEEYFLEYQLKDAQEAAPLRSESQNQKMRPDAVVKYPDHRSIIIDSKVSLNAFLRATEAETPESQKAELLAHVTAVRNHVLELSTKGYDDYDKTLDFVMMFIPNESGYMAAIQEDPGLWNFAYERRILLVNPTNLIISLKLISDLWKREYQNRNAQDIADRGAKLYDKFVGFTESLMEVGKQIGRSQEAYAHAYKQLTSGNDNLVLQATKLKGLGLKTKKELVSPLVEAAASPLVTE